MPLATSRLELLQVRKLIQCVRTRDTAQIHKMAEQGVSGVLNFQGRLCVHAYNLLLTHNWVYHYE